MCFKLMVTLQSGAVMLHWLLLMWNFERWIDLESIREKDFSMSKRLPAWKVLFWDLQMWLFELEVTHDCIQLYINPWLFYTWNAKLRYTFIYWLYSSKYLKKICTLQFSTGHGPTLGSILWVMEAALFDHTFIFVKLPSSGSGTGLAGACRDGW